MSDFTKYPSPEHVLWDEDHFWGLWASVRDNEDIKLQEALKLVCKSDRSFLEKADMICYAVETRELKYGWFINKDKINESV